MVILGNSPDLIPMENIFRMHEAVHGQQTHEEKQGAQEGGGEGVERAP